MKKFNQVSTFVAMTIMVALATATFAGCSRVANSQNEAKSTSPAFVVEVRKLPDGSSVVEESKVESQKEESKVESSVESQEESDFAVESSSLSSASEISQNVRASNDESSAEEKSEVESSTEISIAEKSEVESSKVESSNEESKLKTSVEESSDTFSVKNAIRYGRVIKRSPLYDLEDLGSFSKIINVAPDSLIAILKINDLSAYDNFFSFETYEVLFYGKRYVIASSRVELFPEYYVPDFSDENWVGLN